MFGWFCHPDRQWKLPSLSLLKLHYLCCHSTDNIKVPIIPSSTLKTPTTPIKQGHKARLTYQQTKDQGVPSDLLSVITDNGLAKTTVLVCKWRIRYRDMTDTKAMVIDAEFLRWCGAISSLELKTNKQRNKQTNMHPLQTDAFTFSFNISFGYLSQLLGRSLQKNNSCRALGSSPSENLIIALR